MPTLRSLRPIRRTSNAGPTLGRLLRALIGRGFASVLATTAGVSAGVSPIGSAAPFVAGGLLVLGATGCPGQSTLRAELAQASTSTIELSDALEKLIADGKATQDDREAAYDLAQTLPAETAGDAFGRAAITGRLAEKKGALSILGDDSPTSLVAEAEKYARLSRRLDPEFRQGAATRMLGTLYVMAPANLLEGGNSEDGIEILEHLVATHPEVTENQLRLAEGYIALSDKDAARAPLCLAMSKRASLRADDAALLDKLAKEVESLDCKPAPDGEPASDAPAAEPPPPADASDAASSP